MQDPNQVQTAPVVKEFVNNLTKARNKLVLAGTLNGKVVKPFKPQAGKRDLFVVGEPVTVTERKIEDTDQTFYIVTGLAYNHKNGKVSAKSASFTPDQLGKYVAYNG